MNFHELEILTLKILETPDKFTSNDFIAIYNTIYFHCTQKSEVFEVKGKEVYDTLRSILVSYFESLKPISSLKAFNHLALNFQQSLSFISSAYSYLGRYYIKSAMHLRDGYTLDITTLAYTVFYTNFLDRYLTNLTDYILFEIDFQRKAGKPKYEAIGTATSHLNMILLYNDLGDVFEDLVNRYYKNFYKSVKETSIMNIIHATYKEIGLSQHFFSFSQRSDLQKLTHCIARRFKEVLDLYVEEYNEGRSLVEVGGLNQCNQGDKEFARVMRNSLFEYFARLVFYMREEHVALFLNTHSQLVLKEMGGLKEVKDLVIYFVDTAITFKKVPLETSPILLTVKKHIEKILLKEDHVTTLVLLVEDIKEEMTFDLLMEVVKLSYMYEEIIRRITSNIQYRLISNNESYNHDSSSISRDRILMASIEKVFGVSYVSWLKIAIERFMQPVRQTFGISNQETDLVAEMRLLTKAFWNFKTSDLGLHPRLRGIEKILLRQNHLMFPRSEIVPCYRMSPAIFSLNEFDFRVSSDVLSLILYFSENDSCEEVRRMAKDTNFEANLRLLLRTSILVEENGRFSINGNFSQRDFDQNLEDLSSKRSRSTRLLDLFEVEFASSPCDKLVNSKDSHLESAVEAFIVRTLKKKKRMPLKDLQDLIKQTYQGDIQVEEIIKKLEGKEFVKVEGSDFISYMV